MKSTLNFAAEAFNNSYIKTIDHILYCKEIAKVDDA